MGIQINWQELLTKEETYFIVVIISLSLFLVYLFKCLARENKGILERNEDSFWNEKTEFLERNPLYCKFRQLS